jgi:hypothetical protein
MKAMSTSSSAPGEAKPKARSNTLRQTASAVFAVTAIVPLLLFVWTLVRLDALSQLPSQVGLALALGIALLGFHIFRRLMGEMSDIIVALGNTLERSSRALSEARTPAAPAGGQQAAWARSAAAQAPRPPGASPPGAREQPPGTLQAQAQAAAEPASPTSPPILSAAAAPTGVLVPGLRAIREVHDLGRAMAVLWQAEASSVKGQRVLVSVLTSTPITGTLRDISDEGIVIEPDGGKPVTVRYERISSIDAERPQAHT